MNDIMSGSSSALLMVTQRAKVVGASTSPAPYHKYYLLLQKNISWNYNKL